MIRYDKHGLFCQVVRGLHNVCRYAYTDSKYRDILENNLWPVIARHFLNQGYLFQDDNATMHCAQGINENNENNENNQDSRITWRAQVIGMQVVFGCNI